MAKKESLQKEIGRTRPPRVHITYDVETNGAIEKKEIPFVVGVLADLAGHPKEPLPPVKEREFVEISRDNFDKVLAGIGPRIVFKVDNKLTDEDTRYSIELKFSSMEDFAPARVAEQIDPLREMLELRRKLANLKSSLSGNDKLENLLQGVIHNTERFNKLKSEVSGGPDQSSGDVNKES